MKHILTIVAILVLLAACAPQTPAVIPAGGEMQQGPPAQPTAPQPTMPKTTAPIAEEAEAASAQTVDVRIENFRFLPAIVTVKKGDIVRWTNFDNVKHTATGDSFDTGLLANGQSGEHTFTEVGIYDYSCTPHPGMRGQVVVE